jgi:hypothetical protein
MEYEFISIPEPENPEYPLEIRLLLNGMKADGGLAGIMNEQAIALAKRTAWLKARIDEVQGLIPGTEQWQELFNRLSELDVVELDEKLAYLLGYQNLINRYKREKIWVELFNERYTFADVYEAHVEEAVEGSDCIDVTTLEELQNIRAGLEYLIQDANGYEEIMVSEVLEPAPETYRFRINGVLSRGYAPDAVMRRTNVRFVDYANINLDDISGGAVAEPGQRYWSKPLDIVTDGQSGAVYIGRDYGAGSLDVYWHDDTSNVWTPLTQAGETALSDNLRDVKYAIPATHGKLYIKIICAGSVSVNLHHIVFYMAFELGSGGGLSLEQTEALIMERVNGMFGTMTEQTVIDRIWVRDASAPNVLRPATAERVAAFLNITPPLYTYTLTTPAATWSIPHNMGRLFVSCLVLGADHVELVGDVDWGTSNANNLVIHFSAPVSGTAYVKP